MTDKKNRRELLIDTVIVTGAGGVVLALCSGAIGFIFAEIQASRDTRVRLEATQDVFSQKLEQLTESIVTLQEGTQVGLAEAEAESPVVADVKERIYEQYQMQQQAVPVEKAINDAVQARRAAK